MEIKILSTIAGDENTLKFSVANVRGEAVNYTILNKLRRIMMSEIETIAFDVIQIEKNTSCLANEILVHRLGLFPVICPELNDLNYAAKCGCNGYCENCSVKFEIHKKGRKGCMTDVTSRDFKCIGGNAKLMDEEIILTRLLQDQEVKIVAFATKGIGRTHAKWSPTAIAVYSAVDKKETNFVFTIESIGNIPPRDILETALKKLRLNPTIVEN